MNRLLSAVVASAALISSIASADISDRVNYQGYLTDSSGTPINGSLLVTFKIYDAATGGNELHSQLALVTFEQGLFDVRLGSFTGLEFDGPRWLGVSVGSDEEMTPRRQLTSVASAFKAADAQTLQGLEPAELVPATTVTAACTYPQFATQCTAVATCPSGSEVVSCGYSLFSTADNAVQSLVPDLAAETCTLVIVRQAGLSEVTAGGVAAYCTP